MSDKISFLQGKNFNTNISFSAGRLYFDAEKKQIWFDSPTDNSM
jgi:hypothetical protein